jgi:hypothetical protein
MKTFEQIVDLVTELSLDHQELLIDILRHRTTEIRRKELAKSSESALAEFRSGNLKTQTADEAIAELRNYLNNPEVE